MKKYYNECICNKFYYFIAGECIHIFIVVYQNQAFANRLLIVSM